jgi:glucosamine--fructose-6-phosphate aminotransferase (isomerizing)
MIEETHLFSEIYEQPGVISRLIDKESGGIHQLSNAIREREISYILIAARGTSDNAARYAKYLFGAINGLTVALATPSLFTIYKKPHRIQNALVLGVSQSGKSPDIVAVLAEAHRQGALTAAITNHPGSDLSQVSDWVINLQAGEELSIAATKTYTSQLAAVALLSAHLANDRGMLDELTDLPDALETTLSMEVEIRRIAPRYRYMEACVVIGRGYNYATAYELALKLKELTYTVAEPYSSADFMHGPLAMIDPGFPVLIIAPSGLMVPEIRSLIRTLKERQAEVIAISDDVDILESARIPLSLPVTVSEWLSPITAIIPGQIFAMHLASARDYDPDRPRGLTKVTETR